MLLSHRKSLVKASIHPPRPSRQSVTVITRSHMRHERWYRLPSDICTAKSADCFLKIGHVDVDNAFFLISLRTKSFCHVQSYTVWNTSSVFLLRLSNESFNLHVLFHHLPSCGLLFWFCALCCPRFACHKLFLFQRFKLFRCCCLAYLHCMILFYQVLTCSLLYNIVPGGTWKTWGVSGSSKNTRKRRPFSQSGIVRAKNK